MGIEKIGINIGKEIIAWSRTGKSLLATRPVKINTQGLRYVPALEKDVVQFTTKNNKVNSEYDELLNSVMLVRDTRWDKLGSLVDKSSILEQNLQKYPNIPHDLKGLLPYCGCDISDAINCYLSGRKLDSINRVDIESIKKFIKLLEYSLHNLDKKFGIYRGYVYRGGFFSPQVKQFYSTSYELNPDLLWNHAGVKAEQYHIIKTKSGHNIHALQEKYLIGRLRKYFLSEKEILLSREAKFQESINNPELEEKKQELAESILDYWKKNLQSKRMATIDDALSKIKMWEEI